MAEREEVLAELDTARMCNQIEYSAYSRLHDLISEIPEQKHGNWVPIKTSTGVKYGGFEEYTAQEVMCSECGFTDDVSASVYTYCPECGAKMDIR